MKIYLDNASTTQIDPLVLKEMLGFFDEDYANSSSPHKMGEKARQAIEDAREIIAKSINASPEEIVFTSGGTEANNFAIKGVAFAHKEKGNHIITSEIEHRSVLNVCKWLEKQGFEITYLDVDEKGYIKGLEQAITDKTILVTIVHGHNEIGVIQDLKKIKEICKDTYFHTDACQSYTKAELGYADLISLNAHKMHGPKGVGALYIKKGVEIDNLMHGGGHESGRRSGTSNVPAIVGFAKAVETASLGNMEELQERLIKGLEKMDARVVSYGLPHIISATFHGIEGEAIVGALDLEDIYVATGSACSSATLQLNKTLIAIGLSPQEANGTVRFSLSKYTTKEEIDRTLEVLEKVVKKLRDISPF